MKNESSYQKLQNEDTLSTISFTPPVIERKNYDKFLSKKCLFICMILISTLLLVSHFILGLHISLFHNKSKYLPYWDQFSVKSYNPIRITGVECPPISRGDTSTEYEDSIEMRLHRMLSREKLPEKYKNSVVLNMIKDAYQSCRTGNEDIKPINEMIETLDQVLFNSTNDEISNIVESIALLQNQFNFETFFKIEILANYEEPDGDIPYTVYIQPNYDFINININETNLNSKILSLRTPIKNLNKIKELNIKLKTLMTEDDVVTSSNWKIVDVNNLNEYDNFNFKIYFKALLQEYNIDVDKIKIIDTNPKVTKMLTKLILGTDKNIIKTYLLKYLKESIVDDFDDCIHVIEKYTPHVATVLYLSTFKNNEIISVRNQLLSNFEKAITVTKQLIQPYLITNEQRNILHERLEKVGLTTEEPDWLQLSDSSTRLDEYYKNLKIIKNSEALITLIKLRRFSFEKSVEHLKSKNEAVRIAKFENIPMSSTNMDYSMIGNWINVPVASFMDINEHKVMFKLCKQIAKIVTSEGLKWSPYGTQRSHFKSNILKHQISNLDGREKCFRAHGLKKKDFSTVLGLEIAYKTLNNNDPFVQYNLPLELAEIVTANQDQSNLKIAAGFLEHVNSHHKCNLNNLFPCYIENA